MDYIEVFLRIILLCQNGYGLYVFWKYINKPSLVGPIYVVFLFFFIFPLSLDWFVGIPEYSYQFTNFKLALEDVSTNVLYNLYMIFISFLFIKGIKSTNFKIDKELIQIGFSKLYKTKKILWIFTISPFLVLPFVDDVSMYLTYRALNDNFEINRGFFDGLFSNTTLLSVFSGTLLFFLTGKNVKGKEKGLLCLLILLIIFISIFFNGKRFILSVFFILIFGLNYFYGIKKKTNIIKYSVLFGVLFSVFMSFYGKNISTNFADTYANFRIDFGRDDVTKFVIFREFIKEAPILEYPYQSFIFNLTFFIPREIYTSKPFPYSVYLTNRLLDTNSNEPLGWSMTSSIFDEALANMGLLGFIFPIVFMFLLRKLSNLHLVSMLLGFFIMLMLVVVQFSATNIIAVAFLLSLIIFKSGKE